MQVSQRIRGLVDDGSDGWAILYRGRAMQAEGKPVVMLSIGDHDIKTAPEILTAMQRSAEGGNLGYAPVPGSRALRQAIADRVTARTRTPATRANITVTSGGQGAIFAAMLGTLDPGDACIILDPYYASFDVTVRAASATPIVVPTLAEQGFQPDPAAIEAAITPRTRALLINTPNNPSGAVYTRERLEAIAEICVRRDLWVISDELYEGQIHAGEHVSIRDLPGMAERTLVIGSMSKGFAMTGSRIGWVVGPKDMIDGLIDLAGTTTYGIPGFLQDAALYALTHCTDSERDVAERYLRRRNVVLEALGNGPGLRAVPPDGGMYVMLDIRATGLGGDAFAERLLDEHLIAVTPGESFGKAAAGHVRVALTVPDEDLRAAIAAMSRFAASLAG